ncbi:MAG: thiamine-phosphate kinase [Gammaproteobacteria bacterium]|nr:thiamine-phosphate kinase [Gammaproteobacteria bacterium]
MDEFTLINQLLRPIAGTRSDVILGIGDDGAVVAPPPGEDLVVVADTLVAGVHFPPQLPAADIGYRAVAVNLSDIAAMGAVPRWATLALTLPVANETWVSQFTQGLGQALREHNVALIGGDTTCGPLTVTVQIIGSVPHGMALTRHGAQPGDAIYVSGTLGDAAAGLRVAQGGDVKSATEQFLADRFVRPTARVALGLALRGIASSCIDISDGLLADLGHIAEQSGCGARVNAAALPLSPALQANLAPDKALMLAATGGDDYELCFTLPQRLESTLMTRLGADSNCKRIGTMGLDIEVVLLDGDDNPVSISGRGYLHFK